MPRPKLTAEERDRVMGEVARLMARGYRQEEIGRRLDISQPMVSYYAQKIKKSVTELGLDELTARRSKVLRELEEVRREAWDAWEKSKKETRLVVTRDGVEERTVEVPGDPRFHATILKALEGERELLNLDLAGDDEAGDVAGGWEILAKLIPDGVPADDVEAEILKVLPPHDPLKNGKAAGANGTHTKD